jgi:predicted MFS family arabinose efflux permease
MTEGLHLSRAKLSTRLAFIAAGFGAACWAPLVPFAKTRCHLADDTMGLVLLLMGAGSVVAMPLAANLSARFSSKPVVLSGGVGLALMLPLLSVVSSPIALGVALFAFGASLGSLDVAMNLHAVDVERVAEKPLMSGFHALFSVGGFLGSGIVTALLSRGIALSSSTILSSIILIALIVVALPRMLSNREGTKQPLFAIPRGVVLVLLVGEHLVSAAHGGLGYMLFSIAMTCSRFLGDDIVARFGNRFVLTLGGMIAVLGLCGVLLAPGAWIGLVSFVFVGLGAANIVPILFRLAGTQHKMPKGLAVAALTTAGYAGMLTGPAVIGFLSKGIGLHNAFWFLAALLACVPIFCKYVTAEKPY